MKLLNKIKLFLSIYGYIFLGSALVAFTLVNIHERVHIAEGGLLGIGLLLEHYLHWPPYLTHPIMDFACYAVAINYLGKGFARRAIPASIAFAGFHFFFSKVTGPIMPDLGDQLLVAAIIGAVLIGTGVGLIVYFGGASNGDDALALTVNHFTGLSVGKCYLLTDLTVLLVSFIGANAYIPMDKILYSVVSVYISSHVIEFFHHLPARPTTSPTSCHAHQAH